MISREFRQPETSSTQRELWDNFISVLNVLFNVSSFSLADLGCENVKKKITVEKICLFGCCFSLCNVVCNRSVWTSSAGIEGKSHGSQLLIFKTN